jgi:hypothetical protein
MVAIVVPSGADTTSNLGKAKGVTRKVITSPALNAASTTPLEEVLFSAWHPADRVWGLLPVNPSVAGRAGFFAEAVKVAESLAPAAAGV